MARNRKLKDALDRYKGVDHKLKHQKKLEKEASKRKRNQRANPLRYNGPKDDYVMSGALMLLEEKDNQITTEMAPEQRKTNSNGAKEVEEDVWDTEEEDERDEEDEEAVEIDISRLVESDSSDSDNDEDVEEETLESAAQNGSKGVADTEEQDDEEGEEEEDIPLSDIASVASDEKGDIVPYQRLTINNHTALLAAHKRIALPLSKLAFSAHQSVSSSSPTTIADVNDDLNRELAFYQQSLTAVQEARRQLQKEGAPFSRPADYFAEMVKSEEHMGRVKQKLVDAAASKRAAQDARRQRDLKKFGKQVQVEKRQEREREKREMLDRVQKLKRKRSNAPLTNENEPDMFDVGLDDDLDDKKAKRRRPDGASTFDGKKAPNAKRQAKDKRYGFGGKKRFSKSGDAMSSADMRDFSTARMKGKVGGRGGKMRPGKSKRAKSRL